MFRLTFGAGLPYERLVASPSGCLPLFAGAVSKHYSDNRYNRDGVAPSRKGGNPVLSDTYEYLPSQA